MIIIVLACIAALFVGWTLGPAVIALPEKYGEMKAKLEESAKKSEEKSYKENKFYSIVGLPSFSPEHHDHSGDRNEVIRLIAVLVFPLGALVTGYTIFWKLFWIAIIIYTWSHIWKIFSEFVFGEKKK